MATNVGDMYVNLKLDIKNLEKGIKKSEKELKKISKHTKSTAQSFQLLNNNMVRSIRRMETVAVAAYTVYKAFDKIIVAGVRLNQQYEDQALGISALVTAKTKMIKLNGDEVGSYDQFIAVQAKMSGVMDDIKKAALLTPASFQQMVGFYQQAIGHAITANGTFGKSIEDVSNNTIQFTQRMSGLGAAMGMEMNKVNEEIRSIMSGNASTDSLLALVLFGSPKEANAAVKNAKKSTEGLSDLLLGLLKPFENLETVDTYTKSMAQLGATLDEIRKQSMHPFFEDIKRYSKVIKQFLLENMDEFIENWQQSYAEAKAFTIITMEGLTNIKSSLDSTYDSIGAILGGMTAWIDLTAMLKKSLDGVAIVIKSVQLGFLYASKAKFELNRLMGKEASGLSDKDKATFAHYEKLIMIGGAKGDAAQKAKDRLLTTARNQLNLDSEALQKDIAIAEKKLEIHALNEDDYATVMKRNKAIKSEYKLIQGIRAAKTDKEAVAAVEAALKGSRGELSVQKEIGDIYAAQVAKIEILNRLKKDGTKWEAKGGNDPADEKKTGAAKALDKYKRDMIALTMQEAELAIANLNLMVARQGILLTERDLTEQNLMLATAAVAEQKKAYDFAKKQGANDPKAKKKLLELEINLIKAKTKEARLLNKTALDTGKKLKDMGDNLVDSLLGGDFRGAIKGLYEDMMDIFIEPAKEKLTSMFGNSFNSLIGGAVDTMMGASTKMAAQSIADSTAAGLKSAPAAVAKGGETGGWYGAAAMLALMVGLGLLGGGGSEPISKEDWQEQNGVINDPQTEGIDNFLESIDKTLLTGLDYSKGMYENLSLLVSQAGKAAIGLDSSFSFKNKDSYTAGALGGLWGGKDVKTLFTGVEMQFSALGGVTADMVEVLQKTKTSWFGLSSKTTTSTIRTPAEQATIDSINAAYKSGMTAIIDATDVLGIKGAERILSSFEGTLNKLDFEGKSQDEIQAMITGAIGNDLNAMIEKSAAWVLDLATVGEEAIETLGRVAVQYEYATTHLGYVGQGFDEVTGSFEKTGAGLFGLRINFVTAEQKIAELTDTMVMAAGGIDEFAASMETFKDLFYTDVEKIKMSTDLLHNEFTRLNVQMPRSNDEFRSLMEGIDITTDAGARLYGQLLPLAGAFDDTVGAINRTIAGLREAQSAYITQKPVTSGGIYSDIGNFETVGNDAISSKIDKWAAQQIEAANAAASASAEAHSARISAINKEVAASNQLRSTIVDLKDSVYNSFRALQGFTVGQYMGSLLTAVNNKDYDAIGGAFNSYTKQLGATSGSKEDFYTGLAEANALVQGLEAPKLREEIAASTKSTSASAATIAKINAEAAAMYEKLIEQNETLLPETVEFNESVVRNLDELFAFEGEKIQLDTERNGTLGGILASLGNLVTEQARTAAVQEELLRNDNERLLTDQNTVSTQSLNPYEGIRA